MRHPIYTGLMLISVAFLLSKFLLIPTVIFSLFIWITNLKANIEEELLIQKYPRYKKYKKKTSKFIPYIY